MALLLSTDPSKDLLVKMLSENKSGVILTAFFSEVAAKWLMQFKLDELQLVLRGRVSDFKSGSSSVSAMQNMLDLGFSVKIHLNLHAKLFWLGDKMLLGSSNLTGNGLNLIESGGNVELNTMLPATADNTKVITNILEQSRPVTQEILDEMKIFLTGLAVDSNRENETWPEDIWKDDQPNLYISDIPPSFLEESALHDTGLWGEIARLHLSSDNTACSKMLMETRIFKWLLDQIELSDTNSVQYGTIRDKLHNELNHDPSIFRKEVADLQAQLFSFLRVIKTNIKISVPGRWAEVITKV